MSLPQAMNIWELNQTVTMMQTDNKLLIYNILGDLIWVDYSVQTVYEELQIKI